MAINKKLISFATEAQFDAYLANDNIDPRSIVFIEDKKRIWTHGVFFDTSWDYVTDKPDTYAPSAHTLGSHSDVTLASLANGNILRYNGSKWVNNTLAQAGAVDLTTNQSIGGNKSFTGNVTAPSFIGNASTASQVRGTVTGTGTLELVRGMMADNDHFRILIGGTASNAGYVEIATGDDSSEPIYVRQYSGQFTSLTRTATLLDGAGNTSFPGIVSAKSFSGNASSATKLASITTTFTGTYPVTFNVNGTIYSHTGITYTGSNGELKANTFVGDLTGNASSASSASSATTSNRLNIPDTRSVDSPPSSIPDKTITAFFKTSSVVQTPPVTTGASFAHILNVNGWQSGNSGGGGHTTQLAFGDSLAIRQSTSTSAWGAWTRLALVTDNVASATKVNNNLTLKFDTGTAENTSLYTYNGSAAKTIDIKAGSNVSLAKTANTITISATNTNTYVTQATSTTASYRPILLGQNSIASSTSNFSNVTNQSYYSNALRMQPSTGNIISKGSVTATSFIGKATSAGNADSASYVKSSGTITTDYNNYRTEGIYTIFANAAQAVVLNRPSNSAGVLEVTVSTSTGTSGWVFQRFHDYSDDSLYTRRRYTTGWSTWRKSYHSGNFANGTTAQYIRGDGSLATYANTNSITGIRAGASGTTTNAIATSPYIKVLDDSTYRSQIRLLGSGATTVKSDAGGNVTISSTNTTYTTGTLAQLNTGTDTTGRLQTAKLLNDWLANRFQVVTALPTSPAAGVFYFIKE